MAGNEKVFKKLSMHNIRVNLAKSTLMQSLIDYCGFLINKGVHKMKSKIEAIQGIKVPKNKDEVRSLVGLVNCYGRFFKNLY